MKKGFALIAATILLAACMTPGQKRAKADAESALSAASATIASARQAGGDTYAGGQMRTADNDLRTAQEKLKAGDWEEASRRAHLAQSGAEDAREEAQTAKKREKAASAVKPEAPKPDTAKKKQQSKPKLAK